MVENVSPQQPLRLLLKIDGMNCALRDGKTAAGQPLKRVAVVFSDPGAAEYNHHALGFARLDTLVGALDAPARFNPDDPADFSTKDDFGV